MKALKKLSALLLALGLVAGFAACGGNDGEQSASQNGGDSVTSETSAPTELVGEEVTEEQMNAAIQTLYTATNFTMVGTMTQKVNGSEVETSITANYADGKAYVVMVSTQNGVAKTRYSYLGQEEGVWYMWNSTDNEIWDKMECDLEEGEVPTSGEYVFEEIFQWCNFTYSSYKPALGMYEFLNFGCPTVTVMVSGGKIVKYIYEDPEAEDFRNGTITYGNATVGELPKETE